MMSPVSAIKWSSLLFFAILISIFGFRLANQSSQGTRGQIGPHLVSLTSLFSDETESRSAIQAFVSRSYTAEKLNISESWAYSYTQTAAALKKIIERGIGQTPGDSFTFFDIHAQSGWTGRGETEATIWLSSNLFFGLSNLSHALRSHSGGKKIFFLNGPSSGIIHSLAFENPEVCSFASSNSHSDGARGESQNLLIQHFWREAKDPHFDINQDQQFQFFEGWLRAYLQNPYHMGQALNSSSAYILLKTGAKIGHSENIESFQKRIESFSAVELRQKVRSAQNRIERILSSLVDSHKNLAKFLLAIDENQLLAKTPLSFEEKARADNFLQLGRIIELSARFAKSSKPAEISRLEEILKCELSGL